MASLLQGFSDWVIQTGSLLEGVVEIELSDLTTHGGLGEKGQGLDGSGYRVRRLVCIADSEIEHSVNLDFDIVACDSWLLIDVEHLLFEWMVVSYCVHPGHLKVKTSLHNAIVFAKGLDHELVPLGDHDEWEESAWHVLKSQIITNNELPN